MRNIVHPVVAAALAAALVIVPLAPGWASAQEPRADVLELALDRARAVELGRQAPSSGVDCAEAVRQGRIAGERPGTGGHAAGGFLLPIIMPLISSGSSATPPTSETLQMDPVNAQCFRDGYSERVRERRTASAWKGTWIGIGLYVGLVVRAAATGPDYSY